MAIAAELFQILATDRLLLVDLALVLKPMPSLDQLLGFHVAQESAITYWSLTTSERAEIYERSCLPFIEAARRLGVRNADDAARALSGVAESLNAPRLRAFVDSTQSAAIGLQSAAVSLTSEAEADALAALLASAIDEPARDLYVEWTNHRGRLRLAEYHLSERARMRGPSRRRRDRLTVLFATSSLGYTGGEKALADLVENVRAVPWVDAQVLARAGSRFVDRCRDAGCDPVLSDFLTEFGLLNYLRVRRALELTRPDIIHLNGYVGPSFLAAARTEGIPVVQHVRVVDSPAMEEHVRTADAIVAISQFTKSEVLLTGVSSAQRLYLIYNGFSHHDWVATEGERENERRRLELPDESWVVIMVARYVANKRHGLLLRAAHLLRRSVPELRLLLVGDPVLDPSGYESCRGLVQQLELEPITKHVTFAANMRGLYAASDVCVIASTREPFGNSACEAVLSDVPVLACGDGGFLEILRPHGADAIVGDQSPEGLAAALGTLYGRPRMHEDVRAERKEWIAETFSMNRYVESVTAVYRNLIP